MTAALTQPTPLPDSPYRGIEPFRYIDQQIFSSREDETWDLLSNILIYRGVLLYGDSGSGKSSLSNASLIPVAMKENLIANRLRIQPRRGREIKVERICTESADKPPYLPSVFVDQGSPNDEALNTEISLTDFSEHLERLRGAPPDEPRPLLIFDQFEEFITLFEEALRGGDTQEAKLAQKDAPELQQRILESLTKLIEDETLPVKVLFVFREDYLAKLNLLFEACPNLLDQYVRLLPPRVEEADKIIRAPFANDELRNSFIKEAPEEGGKEIPEQLAKAIATQLQERSESGFLNLSELQIVCRKLWESPDPVHLFSERNGNIQKILEDHWADVLIKLGELYDPAIALLGHMVTSSNTRNIVSEPDLRSNEKDNFTTERIEQALDALVERKLVRREPRHKIYFYEIASEFLVPWIQQKKATRLAEIQARKLAAEAQTKLEQAEKEKRRLLIGAGVLVALLVLAVGLALYSIKLKRTADDARNSAVDVKGELQGQREYLNNIVTPLDNLTNPDDETRLNAVKSLVKLHQEENLPPAFVPLIVAATAGDKNQDVSKAASYFFGLLVKEASTDQTIAIAKSAEQNSTFADSVVKARVYIQIVSDDQRPRADKIANALRSIGFIIPAYELVDSRRAPSSNQVRYYKSPDESGSSSGVPDPNEILKATRRTDSANWSIVALKPSSSVRPGHFEIWFANDAAQNVSASGLGYIAELEGDHLTVYRNFAGLESIGVGHLLTNVEKETGQILIGKTRVDFRNGITKEQALQLFKQDVQPTIQAVRESVKVKLTQNQFDALVAFAWDAGKDAFAASVLVKVLNQGKYDEVPNQLLRWNKAGGRVIPELTERRNKEIQLWNKK